MAFLNASTRELHINVAYFGPALSGKLTNLRYIHERSQPDARSEWAASLPPLQVVAFYFTPLQLGSIDGNKLCFHLSAVTGHVFEDEGRKRLLRNIDAVVFVADAQAARLEANLEMWENLEAHLAEQGREDVPTVLQINKVEHPLAAPPEEVCQELGWTGPPAVPAEALRGAGVFETLKACAKLVITGLRSGRVKQQDFVLLKAPREPLRLWDLFRSDLVSR